MLSFETRGGSHPPPASPRYEKPRARARVKTRVTRHSSSTREHMSTSFLYLGNGWTDFDEIWCVVRDQLFKRFAQVKSGVHLQVRTCVPLFHVSGTAERIALKFGVRLETHYLCVLYKPSVGCIRTCARANPV